jgi:ribosomal protein L29
MQMGKAGATFRWLLLAALISVQGACGQQKEDRLLDELATRIVLRASLEKLSGLAGDVVSTPMNVPLQLKLARALLLLRGSDDAELLKARISILRLQSSITAVLARDPDYVEAALKNVCDEKADNRFQAAVQTQELEMNEQVTPELSKDIARVATMLESDIAKELIAAINEVKPQLRRVIARKPGMLQPCASEKPAPQRLQDSWTRVSTLLNQAWAKRP